MATEADLSKSIFRRFSIYLLTATFFIIFLSGCQEQSKADVHQKSFGLSNSFYGRCNRYQEQNLPQAMRGAYRIEAVRNISMSELAGILKEKQLVAEEIKKGEHYVAMRDTRIVQFNSFSAALMIYIERYRIVDD